MQALGKFGFRVRAHNRALIERILIHARSEEEARARLFRMYPRSEVLSSWVEGEPQAQAPVPIEEIVDPLGT